MAAPRHPKWEPITERIGTYTERIGTHRNARAHSLRQLSRYCPLERSRTHFLEHRRKERIGTHGWHTHLCEKSAGTQQERTRNV